MTNLPEGNTNLPPTAPVQPTSTMAIVSLVAGILGWTVLPFIGGIIAIYTGNKARDEIKYSSSRILGDGLAVAGLVLGYANVLLGLACCLLSVLSWMF